MVNVLRKASTSCIFPMLFNMCKTYSVHDSKNEHRDTLYCNVLTVGGGGGGWDEVIQIGRLVEQEIIEPEEAIIPDFVHTPYGGEKNEPKYDVTPELGMLLFQAAV